MAHRMSSHLPSLALACTVMACAAALEAAPPSPPGRSASPWNTGTAPPAPRPATEDGTLALRLYEDRLPYRPGAPRRDDPAWAVDVSAVMTRCPDGNLVITALVIGGQLTPLDNRCPAERRDATPPAPGTAPQCDAKSWNCRTGTRE